MNGLREGVKLGKIKVSKHCKFGLSSSSRDPPADDESSESDDADNKEVPDEQYVNSNGAYVEIGGRVYHTKAALTSFLNDGGPVYHHKQELGGSSPKAFRRKLSPFRKSVQDRGV